MSDYAIIETGGKMGRSLDRNNYLGHIEHYHLFHTRKNQL